MKVGDRLRTAAKSVLVQQLLTALGGRSDQSLIRLTRLAERLPASEVHQKQIAGVRGLFEQHHPALQLARRIVTETHPHVRRRVLMNLFVRAMWEGSAAREDVLAEEGFLPPYLIVISPTMRCNLRRYGCYAGAYQWDGELSPERVDQLVGEAKELGIHFITITGGEPFIRPDLLNLFEKHPDVVFHIYTNGTLINAATAKRMAELGNAAPAISVEGFQAETDARRGEGVYAKVEGAMNALRDSGCLYGFSATVTRQNADLMSSDAFIDHYVNWGCYFGWFFIYMPIGRKPDLSLMPTPEQRDRLREKTLEIRRTRPIFVADFWDDGPLTGGCIAGGRTYAHINHRGDVEPCVFAHFAVDNIHEKPLKEALNSPFFRAIRARQPFSDNQLHPCMIIDHPHVLREVVAEARAHSTDGGGEGLLIEHAEELDAYAAAYGALAQAAWEQGYEWAKGGGLL
ncbi:MAG: radical SAM protein [Armatimonadetes bacterium CG_4_9_14_3_um_filter_66_14]|nr:MAG: radical SAM protein [Armatimonadetes bacterium CG_4_9_14_3_um_filter_66_14]